jgi:tRNA uridine 5-carboxymethylaminomethyl modification enzyme
VEDAAVAEQVEIQARYAGYIERQRDEIERQRHHEETRLPEDLDYGAVHGLSTEARQKLAAARPLSLGQAARIPGVTPAAISLLLLHLKKHAHRAARLSA